MIYITFLMVILYSKLSSTEADYRERIAVGSPVHTQGAYPYMVSIQKPAPESPIGYVHFCGGSLIESRIMVTAAHCLRNASDIYLYRVLPNYRNSPFINDNDLTFTISAFVEHPLYNISETPIIIQHDIAVVLLNRPDPRPGATINLPVDPPAPSTPVTMIGYGMIAQNIWPDTLQEAHVFILPDEACIAANGAPHFAPIFNLCTANGFISAACEGDSGGPLVWRYNNISYILGVAVSAWPPCGMYSVTNFVNVYVHLDFINSAIGHLTNDQLRSDKIVYVKPSLDYE